MIQQQSNFSTGYRLGEEHALNSLTQIISFEEFKKQIFYKWLETKKSKPTTDFTKGYWNAVVDTFSNVINQAQAHRKVMN